MLKQARASECPVAVHDSRHVRGHRGSVPDGGSLFHVEMDEVNTTSDVYDDYTTHLIYLMQNG